ncbi:hypothetical protein GLYMA_08G031600v4 [Glycine max]|uniref:AP complex mu/sigma subunit domain-containing protein n=2 Tax=Glycine subgen. Soja TaxID=1462606 RepID=I1KPU9_SOYBN|nr:AP-4 complex subunit sigma [Glycine max]XP_014634146.1 AP-4 complex subunit sigma [Glycine max]XP_025985289.1 AP-4 complex subunit sigma [Glycine max]XP_028242745.1 AP-4 complex subunit sigma-like [Glycine soja]XP_028242746.1 AP-4 complex subunit sigma-like [Glycine soja]XP_028242747.1 AP-4 complex subunit sigma-like [Glycine soja]KAG4999149.1 hypothetical protein JHK87_020221 [Glycine soja]KAH1049411.1 hypothetical protein GYH30_020093 [Glycine max]KHN16663.1 AP-4 complex subunit sigma |eukprot:XP_006584800.1 AP-4 complex subunit sigma [Glycine max]
MGMRLMLMVNKQGQTRLAQYYEHLIIQESQALEGKILHKCLARNDNQCSFVEHRNYGIVYRRYASVFFLVGVDVDESELAILEFIHLLVETMDRHPGNVCVARYDVSFRKSTFYAGGNGHEWLHCGDKQSKYSVSNQLLDKTS